MTTGAAGWSLQHSRNSRYLGRHAEQHRLEDLVSLRISLWIGGQIDKPGKFLRDFHTVGGSHLKNEVYGLVDADSGRLKKNSPLHATLAVAIAGYHGSNSDQ